MIIDIKYLMSDYRQESCNRYATENKILYLIDFKGLLEFLAVK